MPQRKRTRTARAREVPQYVYAVVASSGARSFDVAGLDEKPVSAIAHDGVAFVVSDTKHVRVRPERKHLAAHRAVLGHLIEVEDAVLPMRFGSIASAPEAVERLIAKNRKVFTRQLERLGGKMEMGLRVSWDVGNIFEYMVTIHHELRDLRDRTFRAGTQPGQEALIELGREFERVLEADRERHSEAVDARLHAQGIETRRGRVRSETEIVNLACLIDKSRRAEFEAAVLAAARSFDRHFAFEYNGPWAPHAFAEIGLNGEH